MTTATPQVQKIMTDKELVYLCATDLYRFGRDIMGYTDAEPVPHAVLCQFLQEDYPRKLVVGSRGYYKTSFGSIARPIQLALENSNRRCLIVQNTIDNARNTVGQIRGNFDQNERLRHVAKLRDVLPENTHKVPWSDSSIQLKRSGIYGEPTFTAAGVETQLATRHYDYIFGDDVVAAKRDDLKEGGIIIIQPEEVEKAIGWYKLAMQGLAIRKQNQTTYVQFIVNRWAMHDFAQYLIDNHLRSPENPQGFRYLKMAVRDKENNLTWPTVFNDQQLAQIRRDQGEFIYWTQYECLPHDPSNRGFPEEDNIYYEGRFPPHHENMNCYALMDLADKTKPAHCCTALVVVYVDDRNHLWVNEEYQERMDPTRKINLIYKVLQQNPRLNNTIHIEENLHNETLQYGLKQIMNDRGHFRIRLLKTKSIPKEARILRLQPHHQRHALHLNRRLVNIPQQMRDFPHSHVMDAIDALGHIMSLVRNPFVPGEAEVPFMNEKISIRELKERMKAPIYGGGGEFTLQRGTKNSFQRRPYRQVG